jgi:hypothetical protein
VRQQECVHSCQCTPEQHGKSLCPVAGFNGIAGCKTRSRPHQTARKLDASKEGQVDGASSSKASTTHTANVTLRRLLYKPGLAPAPEAIVHLLQQASKVQLLHAGRHSSTGCRIILQAKAQDYVSDDDSLTSAAKNALLRLQVS